MMRNASLSKQQDFLLREAMHLTGLFTWKPAHLMWKVWIILVHCCFFLHPFLAFQFLGALKGKIDKERSLLGRVPGMVDWEELILASSPEAGDMKWERHTAGRNLNYQGVQPPRLKVKTWRLRAGKWLAQGHPANEKQDWGPNLGHLHHRAVSVLNSLW